MCPTSSITAVRTSPKKSAKFWEQKGYVCGYTLLNASFYGVPQMRERMFLIAYRRELEQPVTFPDPTHWLVLPSGYEGSRAVALKMLNGLFGGAHDYIHPPSADPKLPSAITSEEAIGDLPPIYARDQLAFRRTASRRAAFRSTDTL